MTLEDKLIRAVKVIEEEQERRMRLASALARLLAALERREAKG